MSKPSNSGVIVALLPDKAYTELRPTLDDHHMTVAFLGRYNDPDITPKALKEFWANLSRLWTWHIRAEVTAESIFSTPDGWAHVDLINAPFSPDFCALTQELLDVHGLPMSRDFGFLPHITRRYIKSPNPVEILHTGARIKFTFDRMALWAGDECEEVKLGAP